MSSRRSNRPSKLVNAIFGALLPLGATSTTVALLIILILASLEYRPRLITRIRNLLAFFQAMLDDFDENAAITETYRRRNR